EVPLAELGLTDLLVKLSVTGICGTNFAMAAGKITLWRSILGHEVKGRVIQLG
ncbi:hypothetical protein ASPWEDRAFT_73656, partial [Aspergillus wentii DTO 134E9]